MVDIEGASNALSTLVDYYHHVEKVMPALVRGGWIAIKVVALAELIGIFLGLVLALCRLYGRWWLAWPALVYVDLIRGTPMLVQILIAYFGIPSLYFSMTGDTFNIDPIVAGIAALGLNSGAYVSEIFRTAIGNIDRGQTEASRALGLSWLQTMRYVVLPQAFRWAIPPLGNEFITLLKDTSLLSVIAVVEIVKAGQLYAARTYAIFPTYIAIAIVYLVLTLTITSGLRVLERKLKIPT